MAIEGRETGSLIGSDKVEGAAVYGLDDQKIGAILGSAGSWASETSLSASLEQPE